MKRSLGRRSSARNAPRTMTFTEVDSAKNGKRSGIPVRSQSTDRSRLNNTSVVLPMGIRSQSSERGVTSISGDRRQTFGTERPSRGTTLSSSSNRLSSFGGGRNKKDNRPIQDKDWQLMAQSKIEEFLRSDPEGCLLCHTIRPINLKLFISIVDLLLRRLEGDFDMTFIHKENYLTELPYILKKLHYRGKVERSWLISVNTSQSWSHALATMDFLVSCVKSQMIIDPMKVMFPEPYCKEDEDIWDYKLLLPYFHKSYEQFISNPPDYVERQTALDRDVIEMHISGDDVFEVLPQLEEELARIREDFKVKEYKKHEICETLEELKLKLNQLKTNLSRRKASRDEMCHKIDELQNKTRKITRERESQDECLDRKLKAKAELESCIANQKISRKELEEMRGKRASLQREIDSQQAYLMEYEDVVFKNSLEVLSIKNTIKDVLRNYSLALLKYPFPGLDEATLTNTLDVEEVNRAIGICTDVVKNAKTKLASVSSSRPDVTKALNILIPLEKDLEEMKNSYSSKIEKYEKTSKESRERIEKEKNELKSVQLKCDKYNMKLDEESLLEKDCKMLQQREKQFEMLKHNAILYITKCMEIRKEYSSKFKELMRYSKQE